MAFVTFFPKMANFIKLFPVLFDLFIYFIFQISPLKDFFCVAY